MTHSATTRRGFAVSVGGVALAAAQQAPAPAPPPNPNTAEQRQGTAPEVAPFRDPLTFTRRDATLRVKPFPMTRVKLLAGSCQQAEQWNRGYLRRLSADRLAHNFRLNAGLASSAEPLGGWEEPKGELRGHFTGHFLSACALTYASTGDAQIKAKGDEMVAELAKCQAKLERWLPQRVSPRVLRTPGERRKVWAPFYTIHKIMAGHARHAPTTAATSRRSKSCKAWPAWADEWAGAALRRAHAGDPQHRIRRDERDALQSRRRHRGRPLGPGGRPVSRRSGSSIRWRCGAMNCAGCTSTRISRR